MTKSIRQSSHNNQGRSNTKTVQNGRSHRSKKDIVIALITAGAVIIAALIGVYGPVIISHDSSVTSTPTSGTSTFITPPPESSPVGDIVTGNKLYRAIILSGPSKRADNLDNPSDLNGWSNYMGKDVGCGFVQGKYFAYAHTNNYVSTCFASNLGPFRDHAYQANMTVNAGGTGGGLIVHSTSPNYNSAMYRFDVRPAADIFDILVQRDNANRTNRPCNTKGESYCGSSAINKTGKNTLAVITQGNKLYFYINSQCVAQITDTTLSSGFIGVFAVDNQARTEVSFDSAEVWYSSL